MQYKRKLVDGEQSIIELDGNGLYTGSNSSIFQGILIEKVNSVTESAGTIMKRRTF